MKCDTNNNSIKDELLFYVLRMVVVRKAVGRYRQCVTAFHRKTAVCFQPVMMSVLRSFFIVFF